MRTETVDKSEHIVQAAQMLFAQFGLRKVTTDDIAREARVSKATVYKYFRNKSEIFNRVVEGEAAAILDKIRQAVNAQTDTTERLRAHLTVRIEEVRSFVNFFRVTHQSWGDYWPHIDHIRRSFLDQEQEIVAGILRDGVEAGEIRVPDVNQVALVLILALASTEYQWSLEEERFSLHELVDLMLKMMIEGIRKQK